MLLIFDCSPVMIGLPGLWRQCTVSKWCRVRWVCCENGRWDSECCWKSLLPYWSWCHEAFWYIIYCETVRSCFWWSASTGCHGIDEKGNVIQIVYDFCGGMLCPCFLAKACRPYSYKNYKAGFFPLPLESYCLCSCGTDFVSKSSITRWTIRWHII